MPDFVESLAYIKEYGCTIFVVSNALSMVSESLCHCWIVECSLRNPNWCEGIHIVGGMSDDKRNKRSFSRALDRIGRRLIGL